MFIFITFKKSKGKKVMTGSSGRSATKHRHIPDVLKEGNVSLLRAYDRGVQKYAFRVNATSKAAPHAILLARELDGNSVVGDAPKAKHSTAQATGASCSRVSSAACTDWKGDMKSPNPRQGVLTAFDWLLYLSLSQS